MSGLVEILKVATDDRESLVNTIKIVMKWNSRVTHYRTGVDVNKIPYLILMWHEGDGQKKGMPLMAPMSDASGIADQMYAWLKNAEYGREPDHDGSNNRGWLATNTGPVWKQYDNPYYKPEYEHSEKITKEYDSSFYDVICIQPYWIEYHK